MSLVFWMVLVVIGALVWHLSTTLKKPATVLTFTQFMDKVDAGQVRRSHHRQGRDHGHLKEDDGKGGGFRTVAPLQHDSLLVADLRKQHINVKPSPT